ncbi:hypothetical protein PYW08_012159 [Mythimna loreyi]|uniref:Uncharacterized protein n=1 Tax=Mythimna loreyi TaxID=667449 RepID=A0ACC2Q4F5_9NEOP|nr:hypothetical protein PYW08_012159 [Mythimna loreyi]
MKYVILHYFFIMHIICNINICDCLRRVKLKHGRYDINGFISQLLASKRFDELAEVLAEKAAIKIMSFQMDPTHVDRAIDYNDTVDTNKNEEKIEKKIEDKNKGKHEDKNKGKPDNKFNAKINPQAVINESISLAQNLQLKYKNLKKFAMEKKANHTKELANNKTVTKEPSKNVTKEAIKNVTKEAIKNVTKEAINNVTTEDPLKLNKVIKLSARENVKGKKAEPVVAKVNATQQKQQDVKNKDPKGKEKKGPNVKAEAEEKKSGKKVVKEENLSSLDEQNQQYLPSAEKTATELDKSNEDSRIRGSKEKVEFGQALAYFRGREDSVEENKLPSNSDKPNEKSVTADERRNHSSREQAPEEKDSRNLEQALEDELSRARKQALKDEELKAREKAPEENDSRDRGQPLEDEESSAREKASEENSRGREQALEDEELKARVQAIEDEELRGREKAPLENDSRVQAQALEDQNSEEKAEEEPPELVVRQEGGKVYTYVQNPEYKDYHEEMAKWKKEHPENPADFL